MDDEISILRQELAAVRREVASLSEQVAKCQDEITALKAQKAGAQPVKKAEESDPKKDIFNPDLTENVRKNFQGGYRFRE